MDVRVARAAVAGIFEMMVLQIRECVRHVLLAGENLLGPDHFAAALDPHGARDVIETGIDEQFRADRASAQL